MTEKTYRDIPGMMNGLKDKHFDEFIAKEDSPLEAWHYNQAYGRGVHTAFIAVKREKKNSEGMNCEGVLIQWDEGSGRDPELTRFRCFIGDDGSMRERTDQKWIVSLTAEGRIKYRDAGPTTGGFKSRIFDPQKKILH